MWIRVEKGYFEIFGSNRYIKEDDCDIHDGPTPLSAGNNGKTVDILIVEVRFSSRSEKNVPVKKWWRGHACG